ncbi:GFA family protein [Bdellovibrio sp. HCB337]|uniref:GFA family protein n=1 Tax=Bdellovibrio sp. HCB337 TaxID=3394358 RepID=UPI0039A487EB
MSTKTYKGSCHCGKISYQVEMDASQGSGRCNCSYCSRTRYWGTIVKPEAFKLLSGKGEFSDYQFNTMTGHHYFCKTCGVATHGEGYLEVLGGAYVSVNLATVEGIEKSEFINGPIRYADGLNNNWMNEPQEKRHL